MTLTLCDSHLQICVVSTVCRCACRHLAALVCMCILACMHVCMHRRIHMHEYTHSHTGTHTHTNAGTHACMHTRAHAYALSPPSSQEQHATRAFADRNSFKQLLNDAVAAGDIGTVFREEDLYQYEGIGWLK